MRRVLVAACGVMVALAGAVPALARDVELRRVAVPAPLSALSQFAIADVTGDGWMDIVGEGWVEDTMFRLVVMPGDGRGGFTGALTLELPDFHDFRLADFDGDAIADIAVGAQQSTIWVVTATGGSLVRRAELTGVSLRAVGDIDGNGTADLLAARDGQSTLYPYLGDGHWRFTPAAAILPHQSLACVQIADLNRDGRPDLLSSHLLNQFSLGQGAGRFAAPRPITVAPDVPSMGCRLSLVDLDGDGILDGVSVADATQAIVVHRGRGDGDFKPAFDWPMPPGATGFALGDVDGDARADVLTATQPYQDEPTRPMLGWLRNDGRGGFASLTTLRAALRTSDVGVTTAISTTTDARRSSLWSAAAGR